MGKNTDRTEIWIRTKSIAHSAKYNINIPLMHKINYHPVQWYQSTIYWSVLRVMVVGRTHTGWLMEYSVLMGMNNQSRWQIIDVTSIPRHHAPCGSALVTSMCLCSSDAHTTLYWHIWRHPQRKHISYEWHKVTRAEKIFGNYRTPSDCQLS